MMTSSNTALRAGSTRWRAVRHDHQSQMLQAADWKLLMCAANLINWHDGTAIVELLPTELPTELPLSYQLSYWQDMITGLAHPEEALPGEAPKSSKWTMSNQSVHEVLHGVMLG